VSSPQENEAERPPPPLRAAAPTVVARPALLHVAASARQGAPLGVDASGGLAITGLALTASMAALGNENTLGDVFPVIECFFALFFLFAGITLTTLASQRASTRPSARRRYLRVALLFAAAALLVATATLHIAWHTPLVSFAVGAVFTTLDLRSTSVRRRLFFAGAILAIVPVPALAATSAAIAAFALLLAASSRWPRAWLTRALTDAGRLAFTAYLAQLAFLAGVRALGVRADPALAAAAGLMLAGTAVAVAIAVARARRRGPIEHILLRSAHGACPPRSIGGRP